LTKVVGDKHRARQIDRDRLKIIEILREKGLMQEANILQGIHDKQQKIRAEYDG